MKKAIYITSVAAVFLFGAEPSAFKAGDLDLPNPYGLTSSEKKIVEQNKNIQNISTKLFDTAQSQIELRNEIDGIKSLVVGHSEKIRDFDRKINSDDNNSIKTLEKRFEENLKNQNENYDKIMKTLSAIAALLDDTRDNYVSKEQLKAIVGKNYKEIKSKKTKAQPQDEAVDDNKTQKPEATKKQEGAQKEKKETLVNSDELFKEAQKNYRDNKLKEAREAFESIQKNDSEYKKGLVAFYIGEIDYKNGEYKTALEQYQKSIEADEKASYVPIILFHTAASLEKLGDKEAAKKILNSLITNYPKHYLLPSAKKKLAEIK
ncbi:MAG: tetratricopeptide repeat protein [Campylobacteraceae bacterium]|jgi:TolA-binding protein|nr:tetratricopeptide repeat protein [Campylobacteraceae bacterium]